MLINILTLYRKAFRISRKFADLELEEKMALLKKFNMDAPSCSVLLVLALLTIPAEGFYAFPRVSLIQPTVTSTSRPRTANGIGFIRNISRFTSS